MNKYFTIKNNIPIFTSSLVDMEINETNWTYEDGKPITGCLVWDKTLNKVIRDLKTEKLSCINKLKEQREELLNLPIDNFDVDKKALENISQAVEFFSEAYPLNYTYWILSDNTEKKVTKEDLKEILNKYLIRKLNIFKLYQDKKRIIQKAQNYFEIKNIKLGEYDD